MDKLRDALLSIEPLLAKKERMFSYGVIYRYVTILCLI